MRTNEGKKPNERYFFSWCMHEVVRIHSIFVVSDFVLKLISWLPQTSGAAKFLEILLSGHGLVKQAVLFTHHLILLLGWC